MEDLPPPQLLGSCIEQLEFDFVNVKVEDLQHKDEDAPHECEGKEGNKDGINECFDDPFQCLDLAGMNCEFMKRLAANSNDYVDKALCKNMKGKRIHGKNWVNITTQEMCRLLGIMLGISMRPRDQGRYPPHFSPHNKIICEVEMPDSAGFVKPHTMAFPS